ncbi:MAG: hypothetical protein QF364_01940 [Candidatus Poseidoniaceae archaeon]|nr:hypothetical protein [Candidatus Poseidoniaceae archaeon]
MSMRKPTVALVLVAMMVLPIAITASADEQPLPPTINTSWLKGMDGLNEHAYTVTFEDNGSYQSTFSVAHLRGGQTLENTVFTTWSSLEGKRIARIVANTSLEWGDEITVSVSTTSWNGNALQQPLESDRSFTVGTWNQPMADHEVLLKTGWDLDQTYFNEEGEQGFALNFNGQGWQLREGNVLNSWELGNGTLTTLENTEDGATNLTLNLESIWKNETVQSGVLTSQVFDARGNGVLHLVTFDGDSTSTVTANVSDGWFNRSMIDGDLDERLRIEATGDLSIIEQNDEGGESLNVTGEVSVFLLETWDENGVRRLQHTQFEALADMVMNDDDFAMDVSLDGLTVLERWEEGVRTEQKNEFKGQGTFGLNEEDENSSIMINGTIHDLHWLTEDGLTVTDDLHMDGVITGDAQGSFGIVRTIEETGNQANATQQVFLVNVIHQETWFNITGINGGNFFDGQGVGANHNRTWDYQVVQSDWENRTVRMVWEETGADPSSGDERPENSPIQVNATQPESEDLLGNISISRETGLMPIPMIPGDTLRLAGQDELALIVTAQSTGNDPRDGFNLHVVNWTGQYENVGTASGAIIDQGPLMGLLSSVYRVLEIPYGEENESANFTESQVVDRILSPSIITAENNTAPQLIDIYFEEGIIYGEGGSAATLVAHIADAEFNVDSVTVDLSPLGGDVTELNDRGLEGDSTIGDNRFSTRILVPGLETGNITLNVTATDTWDVSSSGSGSIEVINLGPRLLDFEILPDTGPRGTQMIINTRAYDGHGVTSVELDLRDVGGQMESFDLVEGVWIGNFTVPNSMVPGQQVLNFVLTDGLGQRTFTSLWHADGANSTMQQIYGPHHISENVMKEISIDVVNSAPTITNPGVLSFERGEGSSTVLLEVAIADVDGVLVARANLGVFTPFTSQETWQNMYDDGSNGDKTANDGIYTAQMQLRSSIPLGTHEIMVQASDSYGKVSPTTSIAVQLVQEEGALPVIEGSILTTGVMIGLLVVFGIGVAAVLFISVRNKPENLDKEDRFGFK